MFGPQRVIIQNKRIKYDFELNRSITIIRGDSATGKTALVDMVREYENEGSDSAIQLSSEKHCCVLEGAKWQSLLKDISDSIVFIDEGNNFVSSKEFATAIQGSSNYYVIVTRESLETLPYSVDEIYGIRNEGKYGGLKQTYNQLYRIYSKPQTNNISPEVVLTEDSNSGFEFFDAISEDVECISAEGKSNIFKKLTELSSDKNILIVADGAAFGSQMEKVMDYLIVNNNFTLYLPESFEWLILSSGILEDTEIKSILESPSKYIDSVKYISWERYFTSLLVEKSKNTYLKYNKKKLNPSYLQPSVKKAILNVMKGIALKK